MKFSEYANRVTSSEPKIPPPVSPYAQIDLKQRKIFFINPIKHCLEEALLYLQLAEPVSYVCDLKGKSFPYLEDLYSYHFANLDEEFPSQNRGPNLTVYSKHFME